MAQATHRAAVLESTRTPLKVQDLPTPEPGSGSILVRVLTVPIVSYTKEIVTGQRQYPLALPFVPGISAIARVEAIGADTTNRHPGQLVYVDPVIRARDDHGGEQGTFAMQGYMAGMTPAARKLSDGQWRNGSWAEKMLAPLESTYPLDEEMLLKRRGFTLPQLAWINILLVPFGGWMEAKLEAGETAIVAFATGNFGSVAIDVALAMGAGRVIAVGRRWETLKPVQEKHGADRVSIVALTGDKDRDAVSLRAATPRGEGAEVFLDLSPPAAGATASSHIQAAIKALKPYGRVLLMGGVMGDFAVQYDDIMLRNIRLLGRFMYERNWPPKLIRLLESGKLNLHELEVIDFRLEDILQAINHAASDGGAGRLITLNVEKTT